MWTESIFGIQIFTKILVTLLRNQIDVLFSLVLHTNLWFKEYDFHKRQKFSFYFAKYWLYKNISNSPSYSPSNFLQYLMYALYQLTLKQQS
jgi:hypothetical protein